MDTPIANTPPNGVASDGHLRDLVERVAESRHFQRAHKLRSFFLFVCRAALEGRVADIREQQIGCEVYGRAPNYHLGEDNIVRVEARELRRRLEKFFEEEGREEPLLIRMPKGGYVPIFEPRVCAPPDLTVATETPRTRRVSRLVWTLTLCCVAAAAAASVTLWRAKPEPGEVGTFSLYKDILGPPKPTLLVLSNPRLLIYGSSSLPPGKDTSGLEVMGPLKERLRDASNNGVPRGPYNRLYLSRTGYTGMGEAASAFYLGRILQVLGIPVSLSQGRFLSWDSARKSNVIVLGSPHINDWTYKYVKKAKYHLTSEGVFDHVPSPGESAVYPGFFAETSVGWSEHGLITMYPTGEFWILVLSGRSSAGTYGVGEFFSTPVKMKSVYNKLLGLRNSSGAFPPAWQVVLRLRIQDDLPIEVTPVALDADPLASGRR